MQVELYKIIYKKKKNDKNHKISSSINNFSNLNYVAYKQC